MSRDVRRCYVADGRQRVIRLQRDADAVRGRLDEDDFGMDAHVVRQLAGGAEILLGSGPDAERAVVVRDGDTVHVAFRGRIHRLGIADAQSGEQPEDDSEDFAASPMTGVVLKVNVAVGDTCAAGHALFVVEAMKMEFVVEAPREVRVVNVDVAEGDRVDIGQVLATFEPEDDA